MLGASFADESLTLGLGTALPSAPAASASSCGAGGTGFGAGGGGIEEDVLGSARPFISAEDKSGSDEASGRAVGGEGLGCGGGMEADDEEELGFRGGGGGIEGFMAAGCGGTGGRTADGHTAARWETSCGIESSKQSSPLVFSAALRTIRNRLQATGSISMGPFKFLV